MMMNKYSYTDQKYNWFYQPTYNGLASSYYPESIIGEDIESTIETNLENPSQKNSKNRRIYELCALASVTLIGLSFFSQLPQLSRSSQAVHNSVSAEIVHLMNYPSPQ